MELIQSLLSNNPCYKAGVKIKVSGLMLHSVGCPQPSAESFIKKWNDPESSRACVHAFIDGNTGKVYQTLPWNHRGWHCGGAANSTHIGVEMCEPSCIKYTGGASFTCSDRVAAMDVVNRTYDSAVELFSFLCGQFSLNPLADGVIISHKEGHALGLASGHGDPDHLWAGLQSGHSMETFRRDVAVRMEAGTKISEKPETPQTNNTPERKREADNNITSGEKVLLTKDAVYYTGGPIPEWVKGECWIVKSISGDRAVIDKNESNTQSICSPINVRYLKKLS